MKSWIGSTAKWYWLMAVLLKILDMTHFMVDCDKIVHVDNCAHFDSVQEIHQVLYISLKSKQLNMHILTVEMF